MSKQKSYSSRKKRQYIISTAIISVVLMFLSPLYLLALPAIESIENGSVTVSNPDENTLVINASDNAIINYSSFSISEGNNVIVNLPSIDSRILNRVLGGEASSILGSLYAMACLF